MAGESNGRKLAVEICNARNLMPKDGQGTASAYVMVDFDGQRRRTRTVSKDLNPKWDERLDFAVLQESMDMAAETLEINIYNDKSAAAGGRRSNFLGRVKIAGSAFCPAGSESLIYYPLEKRSVFSQVKGEIGIKVWYEDPAPAAETEAEKKTEAPPPAKEEEQEKKPDQPPESAPAAAEEKKKEPEQPAAEGEKKEPESKEEEPKKEEPPAAAETPQPPPAPEPPAHEEAPAISQQAEKKPKEEIVTTSTKISSDLELRSGHAAYDLVDRMPFLYVRVVKAKCPNPDSDSSIFAKLLIGTHTVKTKSQADNKEWDQVFAFDKEGLNSTSLEVSVWTEKQQEVKKEEADNPSTTANITKVTSCLGTVSFDLQEVPKRVPPDSPLAPQWYTLEGSSETAPSTDVMVAVWLGTQADEAFQEAWQSDSGGFIPETRSKVYLSPKLWYLRLTVIQTQDLQLVGSAQSKPPRVAAAELYVKAQLGSQIFKTARTTAGPASTSSSGPTWNEDLIFVAAEPFEPFLVITVEDVAAGKPVGHARVNMASIDKRTDDRTDPKSRWFNLVGPGDDSPYAGRIHVSVCLEGGYHVLDEAAHVTSDVQPSAKQLTKAPIGLLEVGIRGATNLLPVKTKDGTRGTTDAYVVAKYGPKWVRTRTILDRFNPRWNEQYTWDVYDPCTVLTIGVFDNGRYKSEDSKPGRDARIGKVRIRLSTLDANRVYFTKNGLTVLLPGGARRMGEIELAIRFTCSSWIGLLQAYSSPVLPRMHYICPMGRAQQDILRQTAMRIVTARMARSEPALGQEVVQFMLDTDTHVFSMRKSKVNWFRVAGGLSKIASLARWVNEIRTWAHPPTTILVHMTLLAVVLCPNFVLPTVFMYAFLILALRVRYRHRIPLSMDPRLSCLDGVGPDELDEEFDGFPSTRSAEVIRIRYDRLRALAGRAQSFLGDIAAQWERVEALYNWKDPRATGIFVVICLLLSLVFYVVPFKAFALGFGFYYLRHPRFRGDMPSVPANFFRRLPSLSDQIL